MSIKKRIVIIGYYQHNNAGDEQYILTMDKIFKDIIAQQSPTSSSTYEMKIVFVDCDKLKDTLLEKTDIFILGGGDVLNNYFIDSINVELGKYGWDVKEMNIIAFSVGIPYDGILDSLRTDGCDSDSSEDPLAVVWERKCKLDIFQHIYVRNKYDMLLLGKYYPPHKITYLPDVSIFLEKIPPFTSTTQQQRTSVSISLPISLGYVPYSPSPKSTSFPVVIKTPYLFEYMEKRMKNIVNSGNKIIAISLNRHIYNPNNPQGYQEVVKTIARFINYIFTSNNKYYVYFVPFNTNVINNIENDILIHQDVMKEIDRIYTDRVISIEFRLETLQLYKLYNYFYLYIPMRLHATLFSIYKHVPFIPIFTTKKVLNILKDIEYDDKYIVPIVKDEKDYLIRIDFKELCKIFGKITNNLTYEKIKTQLSIQTEILENAATWAIKSLTKSGYLFGKHDEHKPNPTPTFTTPKEIYDKIQRFMTTPSSFSENEKREQVVSLCSYLLTKDFYSPYKYGLSQKIFLSNYDYEQEWGWVLQQQSLKDAKWLSQTSRPSSYIGYFNMEYVNQKDGSGFHRSGWSFVYDRLKEYQSSNSDLYLDLYVDRSFHWEYINFKNAEIIPYRTKWMGFIHHTFDTTFSKFNCHSLLENPEFIASLPTCKALFVLSKNLKEKLEKELIKIKDSGTNDGGSIPPVYAFTHPTVMENIPMFDYELFKSFPIRSLVHVGGWLRNVLTFYELDLSQQETIHNKVVLQNKNSGNYYPFANVMEKISNAFMGQQEFDPAPTTTNEAVFCSNTCSNNMNELEGNGIMNNWYKHYYEQFRKIIESVEVRERLSNEEYDTLLSQSVLFLHLVDASAVNTIIECIARCVPIIVNRHPAVVEILGDNYPLFYEEGSIFEINTQVNRLLSMKNIYDAHVYLSEINKQKFHIDYFVANFIQTINQISDYREKLFL